MKVNVYSRQQICEIDPIEGTAVISISSPGDPAPLKEGWDPLLRVEFHDLAQTREELNAAGLDVLRGQEIVIFDGRLANKIDRFCWDNSDKDFIVHCDAGVSRSVAVGLFLKEIFQAELYTHAIHTTKAANGLVHRTLIRKYWQERLDRQRDGG